MEAISLRASAGSTLFRSWNHQKRQTMFSFVLLLPASAVVLLMIVYPLYRVFDISLRDGKVMNFARIGSLPLGFGNYARVLADNQFWHSAAISAVYVFGSVGAAFLIGLGTALLLNKNLPGSRVLRTLLLMPWAVPGVIVSIVFLWVMDGSFGVFNFILRSAGLMEGSHAWFVDSPDGPDLRHGPDRLEGLSADYTHPARRPAVRSTRALRGSKGRWRHRRTAVSIHHVAGSLLGPAYLVVLISALGVFRDVDIIFATTGAGPPTRPKRCPSTSIGRHSTISGWGTLRQSAPS